MTKLEEEQNEIGKDEERGNSSSFSSKRKEGLVGLLTSPEEYFRDNLELEEFEGLETLVRDSNGVISWDELSKEGIVKIKNKKVEGIYWKGDLILGGSKIKTLRKIKIIHGDVSCEGDGILEDLGELEEVGGFLYLRGTSIKSLGNLRVVGGELNCENLKTLEDIGELEEVGRWLDLEGTLIKSLGNLRIVGRDLDCGNLKILEDLGQLDEIRGNMHVEGISIESKIMIFRKIREGKLKVEKKIIPYGNLNQIYKGGKLNYKKFRKKYGDNINRIEDEAIKEIAMELLTIEYKIIKEELKEKGEKIQKENKGKRLTEEEKKNIRGKAMKLGKEFGETIEKVESFGVKVGDL